MKIFFTVSIKYIFQLYISHECLEVAYYVWWQCSGVYCLTINTYCLVRKNAYVLSSFNTWLKWNRYIDLIEPNFLLLWGFFFIYSMFVFLSFSLLFYSHLSVTLDNSSGYSSPWIWICHKLAKNSICYVVSLGNAWCFFMVQWKMHFQLKIATSIFLFPAKMNDT